MGRSAAVTGRVGRVTLVALVALVSLVTACGEQTPPGGPATPGPGGPGGGGGGGGGGYATPEQLMAAAPPQWKPEGTKAQVGTATFISPSGWAVTTYTDGVATRSPDPDGNGQCEVFVLAPRPTASGESAQFAQLLEATQGLFPQGTVLQDQYGGADTQRDRWRGTTGRGWRYVGLFLSVNQSVEVLPFLADFGGTAVPVVIIEPRSATTECVNVLGDFGVGPAAVFHSLALEGVAASGTNALAANAVGLWFSSDGSAGSQYLFGANGRFIDTDLYGGPVEVAPGEWQDQYASWTGTGAWAVRGDVLGLFPTGSGAHSRFVRQLQVADAEGNWSDKLCWVASYEGAPYTHCLWRTAP